MYLFQSILNDMVIQKPTMEALKVCRSRKKSSSIDNEVATNIKVLSEKWEKLSKQTSDDHTRLTKQLKSKLAKETSFNYEDWKKRVSPTFYTNVATYTILILVYRLL